MSTGSRFISATAFVGSLVVAAACSESQDSGDEAAQSGDVGVAATAAVLEVDGLKTPAAFADIEDDEARAAALFAEIAKVMQHPRCANCHPVSDRPTQGDEMRPHDPPVVRAAGMGAPGMTCTVCHRPANVEYASTAGSIPGAEPWLLAPASMGWAGVSDAELCAQLKDPELNGGRSFHDLIRHNGRDHLVNWAWRPGEGRTPAPGDQETLGALTAAWVEAGAGCPTG
jgi:hypothetical protein